MWCYPEGGRRESNLRRQNASRPGDAEVMFSLPPTTPHPCHTASCTCSEKQTSKQSTPLFSPPGTRDTTTYRGSKWSHIKEHLQMRRKFWKASRPARFHSEVQWSEHLPWLTPELTARLHHDTVFRRVGVQEQRQYNRVLMKNPWDTAEPVITGGSSALIHWKGTALGCKTGHNTL